MSEAASRARKARTLGIIALVTVWVPVVGLVLAIMAIVFGYGAGKRLPPSHPDRGAATAGVIMGWIAVGVTVLVGVTVVLAAVVFVLVSNVGSESAPEMHFLQDARASTLTLVSMDGGDFMWSDFDVTGCTKPDGAVRRGDRLTSCAGRVQIVHVATGEQVYATSFG